MNTPAQIAALVADPSALFVINHSGGKDSQAMMIKLLELGIPASRLVAIHADLSEVEWAGTKQHAQAQAEAAGIAFIVARAVTGRGKKAKDKSFFDMVRERKAANLAKGKTGVNHFPSKGCRECTSALKRDPINKQAIRYAKAHGFSTIVSCMGLRAEESDDRAELSVLERNARLEIKDSDARIGYTWLPIHDMKVGEVFATIAQAGQQAHRAYSLGNDRLSCVLCFQASKGDLVNGAKHNPAIARLMIELEDEIGGEFHISRKPLRALIGEAIALAA